MSNSLLTTSSETTHVLHESTLLGWSADTWHKAFEWAGLPSLVPLMYDEEIWPQFFAVRERWLKAGGPIDGPSSNIEWVKSRGRGI